MHHGLSCALAEGPVESVTVVQRQVVPDEWLATILVYSLQNLIDLSNLQTNS